MGDTLSTRAPAASPVAAPAASPYVFPYDIFDRWNRPPAPPVVTPPPSTVADDSALTPTAVSPMAGPSPGGTGIETQIVVDEGATGEPDPVPYEVGQPHNDNPQWVYNGYGIWRDTKSGALRTSDEFGSESTYDPTKDTSDWIYDGRDFNTGQSRWKNKKTGKYYVGPDDPDTTSAGKAEDWEKAGTDPRTGLQIWKHKKYGSLAMGNINPALRNYSGMFPKDPPPPPPGGSSGGGNNPGTTDPFKGFEDYETKLMEQFGFGSDIALDLARTGGITDAHRKAVRGRADDSVTGITDALKRQTFNRKAITGGGVTFDNVASRIQDQGSRTGSDVRRDAELGLSQTETRNKLAGLAALFGGNQAQGQFLLGKGNQNLNWANIVGNQELGRGQLQNSRLMAISSLLGGGFTPDASTWDRIMQLFGAVSPSIPGLIDLAGGD